MIAAIDRRRMRNIEMSDLESFRANVAGFRLFEVATFRIKRNLAILALFDSWPICLRSQGYGVTAND
jgi:hypothetical protein